MANYCDYEIHARGSKKACYVLFGAQPCCDEKIIDFEEGTDDDFIIHYTGACKWSLDAYCSETIEPDKIPDWENATLEKCQDEDDPFDFWYYTMQLKSEILGLEIVARSWSDESEFDQVEHFKNGETINFETLWDGNGDFFEEYDEESEDDDDEYYPMAGETEYDIPF